MQKLKTWMKLASKREIKELADGADTSPAHLYQLSEGYRVPSAAAAGEIEAAAKEISKLSKGRLPRLRRGDLSLTCANCLYYKKCVKGD